MAEVGSIFPKNEAKKVVEVGKAIRTADEALLKYAKDAEKLITLLKSQNVSFDQLQKAQAKATKTTKDLDKVGKQLTQSEEKLKQVQDKRYQQILKNRTATTEQTKATKQLQRAQQAQKGSIEQLSAVNSILEKRLKGVNQTTATGAKRAATLRRAIDRNNAKIKEQSSALSAQRQNIGNYGSAMQGMGAKIKGVTMQIAGALGLTSAVFLLVNVLKGSFSTIRQFGKENAVLAGVLGTTRKEIKQLTNNAISLGAVYPVTASEVVKLQVAFARLGFTQSEIINLTEATIQGSIALNAELDATATLVGAVVRVYSELGTEDAGAIIDKLTLATQRSSLAFTSLETGLPKVAGAANAVNMPLDKTLALLGIAQDATLDASISSTSLRNILLELSKTGMTLEEALDDVNTSSNRLKRSYELFGKRAAIVALAFADNIEKVGSFTEAINKAGGTSDHVAKEQMNTLDGAIKSLQSSWEKFVLSFRESEGVLTGVIRRFTRMLDVESDEFITGWEKFIQRLPNFILPLDLLFGKSIDKRIEKRRELLNFLNEANREELEDTFATYIEKANSGDKFSKKVIEITLDRLRVLEKAEGDAAVRKRLADKKAELERIALADEAAEADRKRTEEEKKLAKERAEAWADETWKKAKKLKDQEDAQQEYLNSFREFVEDENELNEDTLSKQVEDTIKFGEQTFEQSERLREQEIDAEERAEEQKREFKKQTVEYSIQQATQLGNTLFSLKNSQLQREFEAAAGNEEKQAALKQKMAKNEKKQALFNIAVDTAQGIMRAIQMFGPPPSPLGIAGIASATALGLLQAGVVASQPIPEFEKGTEKAPDRFVAGEKGRELMKLNTGELMMVDKATYFEGNKFKGATIKSNQETERIISQAKNNDNFVFDTKELKDAMVSVERAITRKPTLITDRSGRIIGKSSNNYREIYLNRLRNGR